MFLHFQVRQVHNKIFKNTWSIIFLQYGNLNFWKKLNEAISCEIVTNCSDIISHSKSFHENTSISNLIFSLINTN